MKSAAVTLLAIGSATVAVAQEASRYEGGPWEGLLADPQTSLPIGPSIAGASPVPPAMSEVVGKLSSAIARGDKAALAALGRSAAGFCLNVKGQPCTVSPEYRDVRFAGNCSINTPYFLSRYDQSVRLEWVCGQTLTFIAFAKVSDGKLVSLEAQTAKPPVPIIKLRNSSDG